MKLKNIGDQVIVLTGATSGIGLTTARMAADKGARLMLIARNEQALRDLVNEINDKGGQALCHAADVVNETQLRDAADRAVERWGRIDTWVNCAGVAIYGKLVDISESDARRLFDTDFWGVVNGSRIAVDFLRENGGALINLGSEVSDAPVPLIGIYAAAKHAVKGFTDALRMELEADDLPISVTLIKPTSIHTPFVENARNYLPFEPMVTAPVYSPDLVAEAILYCAQNRVRDFFVGEMAAIHSGMASYTPRLNDKFMEWTAESMQDSGKPAATGRRDGLHHSNSNLRERGSDDRFVMERSVYQKVKMHPMLTAGLFAGGGIAVAALIASRIAKPDQTEFHTNDGMRLEQGNKENEMNRNMDIAEHMEVVGSDGAHVGTVDHLEGDQIKLTKADSPDGRHHRIPVNDVESVDQNRVMLSQTAQQAKAAWQNA